jgi:HEAT repeat protein
MSFLQGLFGPPNIEKLEAKRDVRGLIKALSYKKDWKKVPQKAAEALGRIRDPRAVEQLIAALKDEEIGVREAAAKALGEISDPRAVEPLIAALRDKEVREAAAKALDKLGWQPDKSEAGATYWIVKRQWDRCVEIGIPAVEPLIKVLKDDRDVAAAKALGEISDVRAVEPLIAFAKNLPTRNKVVTAYEATAYEALGRIRDSRAMEPLIAALYGRDRDVREAATIALERIGTAAVEPLIKKLRGLYGREVATIELERIGTAAVEPLIAALMDEGSDVRQAAALALIEMYQSRKIDDEHRRLILAKRDTITQPHGDQTVGEVRYICDFYFDHSKHNDSGIGVEFPL